MLSTRPGCRLTVDSDRYNCGAIMARRYDIPSLVVVVKFDDSGDCQVVSYGDRELKKDEEYSEI